MKGKRIRQINTLLIRHTELYGYAVWTPDGRCLEDRLSMEQAISFCEETRDFIAAK